MDPTTSFRLAEIMYAERVAEAKAHGAYSWLPERKDGLLAALVAALRAFVSSLRPGRRSLGVRQPAS